jgi:hypothetical protein
MAGIEAGSPLAAERQPGTGSDGVLHHGVHLDPAVSITGETTWALYTPKRQAPALKWPNPVYSSLALNLLRRRASIRWHPEYINRCVERIVSMQTSQQAGPAPAGGDQMPAKTVRLTMARPLLRYRTQQHKPALRRFSCPCTGHGGRGAAL